MEPLTSHRVIVWLVSALALSGGSGCTSRPHSGLPVPDAGPEPTDAFAARDAPLQRVDANFPDTGPSCTNGSCYTVYAHSDHVLYAVDLTNHMLTTVGPFQPTGTQDTMTDLAVRADGTIYTVSHTTLYTADPSDGHVTRVASLGSCGTETVALSFGPDGTLYAGDYQGAFCHIDVSTSPPRVTQTLMLSGGYALSGDLVVVADGTMYGTVYRLGDPSTGGTQTNNLLAQINPSTAAVTVLGSTGYPKLFGVAYQLGEVFGFTHDGSGDVVTIDHTSGVGTLFGTFMDPTTGHGISFAGAGVNVNVPRGPF